MHKYVGTVIYIDPNTGEEKPLRFVVNSEEALSFNELETEFKDKAAMVIDLYKYPELGLLAPEVLIQEDVSITHGSF